LPDLDGREQISLWPVAVMALVMGVISPYWMTTIDPAVASLHGPEKNAAAGRIPAASAGGQK
jgi:NADH-quinone oxidoreductase subunit M